MSIQNLNTVPSPESVSLPSVVKKRTRRTHPKVRTGCITCKIRRKKCDETKPECRRCTSTGRKCDGYEKVNTDYVVIDLESQVIETDRFRIPVSGAHLMIPALHGSGSSSAPSPSFSSSSSSPSVTGHKAFETLALSNNVPHSKRQRSSFDPDVLTINLTRAPSIFPSEYTITDLDNHCFSYFRHQTGPRLASYFSSTIWQRYSLNIGLSHPVVFACAAALGAVHRRFNLGISAEALRWCAYSDRLVRNARRLLNALERDVSSCNFLQYSGSPITNSGLDMGSSGYGVEDNDILMTAHMLLFHFESFQSDFPAAVSNLKVGLKYLLLRPMKLLHSRVSCPDLRGDPEAVIRFFAKIKARAKELFGSEETISTSTGNDPHDQLPPIPIKFNSLAQARDCMFAQVDQILYTPDWIWGTKASRIAARSLHLNRLLEWSAAYAEAVLHMNNRTETDKRIGCLLRITRSLAYLLLYFALNLTARTPPHVLANQNDPTSIEMTARYTEKEIYGSEYKRQSGSDFDREGFAGKGRGWSNASACTTSYLWRLATQREDLMSSLYRLQIWADTLLDPTSPFQHLEHSVSFDSGVGLPRDTHQLPQSSGKTRFMVKYIKERSTENTEDTDVLGQFGIYSLAEQSSAIEEHAVLEVVQSRLLPGTILKWVDLTLFVEERRVLLQYCCNEPDEVNRSPRWMQEWWVF